AITVNATGVLRMTNSMLRVGTASADGSVVGGLVQLDPGASLLSDGAVFTAGALGSTGTVNVTGGTLTVTNGVFAVGNNGSLFSTGGVGHVTVSSGLMEASSVLIGDRFGNDSSFTVTSNGHVLVHGGLRSNGIKTTTI